MVTGCQPPLFPTLLDSTTNMVLFDDQRRIKKYNSPEEILEDFYAMRLALFTKRKAYLADQLNEVGVGFSSSIWRLCRSSPCICMRVVANVASCS